MFAATLALSCARRADPVPRPQVPPFEFAGAWGDKGNGPGKLDTPIAFAVDTLERVYFADPGAGFVHKFESGGTPLLSFEDTRIRDASGIAVDRGGAIYVADAEHGDILIFFPDGTFLRAMRMAPQPHFSGPLGISVDNDGNLYVPDPSGSRVEKFDNQGRLVKSWHVPANTTSAKDRSFSIATAQDGSVFVARAKSGLMEKYSPDGSLLTSWKAAEDAARDSDVITGIAVTEQFVLTASPTSPRIRVWTLDGQHKLDDDLEGHLDGAGALLIAVTPRAELLVFDPAAVRVFQFHTHLEREGQ